MKKALVCLVLVIAIGGWTANKFLQRAQQNASEKERFLEQASNYNHDAEIFLTAQTKLHHDEAFAASYRMWKFSPISEIDLASHYNEQTYYRTLAKLIAEAAKNEGQTDAYNALLDIGQYYGVPVETPTKKTSTNTPAAAQSTEPSDSDKPSLKQPKLGDKRTVPGGRRRDDDR